MAETDAQDGGGASGEDGLVLGLPGDVLAHVMEWLDGDALLGSLEVCGAWQRATARCEAAWVAAQCRFFEVAPRREAVLAWGPESYRLSRARFRGVFVVELSSTGERAGVHWWAAPRRVASGWSLACLSARDRRVLEWRRLGAARHGTPCRPFEDAATACVRVGEALERGLGIASLAGLSLFLVAPHFAGRAAAARVAATLLTAGCRRVRVEHAATCAALAATGADRVEDLPPGVVVLDVGATAATAVPLLRGGAVPLDVVESVANVHSHKYTALRSPVAGDAVSAALPLPEPLAVVEAAKHDHAYCRHASPDARPPRGDELDFARVALASGAVLDRARFECAECLYAPPPPPVLAALPSMGAQIPNSAPPSLPRILARAAALARARVSLVVLAGGGAALRGLGRRLRRELKEDDAARKSWASTVDVAPENAADRVDLVWRGAAKLARALDDDAHWISPHDAWTRQGPPSKEARVDAASLDVDAIRRRLAHLEAPPP